MNHILDFDPSIPGDPIHEVFEHIWSGTTLLFLGAGASVGDTRFLSKDIVEFYSAKIGVSPPTTDLTEYATIMSSHQRFSRETFDDYIVEKLATLKPTVVHKTIAQNRWRQIITTNYDTLVERSFDACENVPSKLHMVRTAGELDYTPRLDEIGYVKLHGCASDHAKYPLRITKSDFDANKTFYRRTLRAAAAMSSGIQFLSVGYSYSDPMAKEILSRFEAHQGSPTTRRWSVSVDPGADDAMLPYYTERRIRIVRCTAEDFFEGYRIWSQNRDEVGNRRAGHVVRKPNNEKAQVDPAVLRRVGDSLKQLNSRNINHNITAKEFYRGHEPDFSVVAQGYNVERAEPRSRAMLAIQRALASPEALVPFVFLIGRFGSGKTTASYDVVHSLLTSTDVDMVVFEVNDVSRLRSRDVSEIISETEAKNVLFLFDAPEVDSRFKGMLEFRSDVSAEQIAQVNIAIVATIRRNMYTKLRASHEFAPVFEADLDTPLIDDESTVLVRKLREQGLLEYRDAIQERELVRRIRTEFDSDPFVAMSELTHGGNHEVYIRNALSQLSENARLAVVFTSLLHRYRIMMPAGTLRDLLRVDWETMRSDIIENECDGILLAEVPDSNGLDPDLYFGTPHPLIAEKMVSVALPQRRDLFEHYRKLIRVLSANSMNAVLIVDLLKVVREQKCLPDSQVDSLFDECESNLVEHPHFALHYAQNLQHRKSIESLAKARDILVFAESQSESRNNRLIHRRAVVLYQIGRHYYATESEAERAKVMFSEARELFELKRILDPFSSFSFYDQIRMELFILERIRLTDEEVLTVVSRLLALFETATAMVRDRLPRLLERRNEFLSLPVVKDVIDKASASFEDGDRSDGDEGHDTVSLLIVRYYDCLLRDGDVTSVIERLEQYSEYEDVALILLQYYGRRLHEPAVRERLLALTRDELLFGRSAPAMYHYYCYVANYYRGRYRDAFGHISELRRAGGRHYHGDVQVYRESEEGAAKVFESFISKKRGKSYFVKVIELQQEILLQRSGIPSDVTFEMGAFVPVRIVFGVTGPLAQWTDHQG